MKTVGTPRQEYIAKGYFGRRRGESVDPGLVLGPLRQIVRATIDVGLGNLDWMQATWQPAVRIILVHSRESMVCCGKRGDELFVGAAATIEQAEIVILAVVSAALGLVVKLKPVYSESPESARSCAPPSPPPRPVRSGSTRSSDARCSNFRSRSLLRLEPFRDQHRLVATELAQAVEIVMRDPSVGAVDVVVRRDRVDVRRLARTASES